MKNKIILVIAILLIIFLVSFPFIKINNKEDANTVKEIKEQIIHHIFVRLVMRKSTIKKY